MNEYICYECKKEEKTYSSNMTYKCYNEKCEYFIPPNPKTFSYLHDNTTIKK